MSEIEEPKAKEPEQIDLVVADLQSLADSLSLAGRFKDAGTAAAGVQAIRALVTLLQKALADPKAFAPSPKLTAV